VTVASVAFTSVALVTTMLANSSRGSTCSSMTGRVRRRAPARRKVGVLRWDERCIFGSPFPADLRRPRETAPAAVDVPPVVCGGGACGARRATRGGRDPFLAFQCLHVYRRAGADERRTAVASGSVDRRSKSPYRGARPQ
jgi:hypothetical protein